MRGYENFQKIMLFSWLFGSMALVGAAQTGTIRGKVIDESGSPVRDVQIEIQRTDIRGNYKTKSDKKGEFFHGGLPLGMFIVRAKKEGFRPEEMQGVRPRPGDEVELKFTLHPGSGKLASEISKEELERLKKEAEAAQKQQKSLGEVKSLAEAGSDLSSKGQYTEAIGKFKAALEKDQGQPYIWARLGDTYAKNNQVNESIEAFKKAIELKPDEPAFHQNLGHVYGKAQKTKEAEEEFNKAASMNPGLAAQNYFNLGAVLVNNGKTQEAIAAFENSIKADPNYAEAYFQLGTAQLGASKMDDAIKNLKKYVEIGKNPQNLQTAKDLLAYLDKKK